MTTERRQVGAPLSFTEKFRFPIWKIDRVEIISLYAVRKNSRNNIMDCIEVFRQAEKEIAESGKLSLTARRKIWQTMGEIEPRDRDSLKPRSSLTEPLKKRAYLALACAKKVMPMWCSVDPDDKSPQNLIKKSLAYLDGKITVKELQVERKQSTIDDFMNAVDSRGSVGSAAVAAWDAMVVTLEDESYLEPWDSDLTDEDIDAYERDAAKEACVAWSNAYTDGDNGKYVIREMRFWAWYLEEAAKIAGLENYRFPPRYIKAFKEKQNPPKPVPEEVTLESFCEFLGVGEYVYNIKGESEISYYNKKTDNYDKTEYFDIYQITARLPQEYGICPVCKKPIDNIKCFFADRGLDWDEFAVPKKYPQIDITRLCLQFRCPDHPKEWIYNIPNGYRNYKDGVKRYIKGEGRLEKLLEELERRTVTKYCKVWADEIIINGKNCRSVEEIENKKEELGLVDTGWIDKANGIYRLDLRQFLSNFFVFRFPFSKFVQYTKNMNDDTGYRAVLKEDEGIVEFEVRDFRFKCFMENGQPIYMQIEQRKKL